MRESGNKRTEIIRQTIEDPMSMFVESKLLSRNEKYERVEQLKVRVIRSCCAHNFGNASLIAILINTATSGRDPHRRSGQEEKEA